MALGFGFEAITDAAARKNLFRACHRVLTAECGRVGLEGCAVQNGADARLPDAVTPQPLHFQLLRPCIQRVQEAAAVLTHVTAAAAGEQHTGAGESAQGFLSLRARALKAGYVGAGGLSQQSAADNTVGYIV